MFWLWPYIVDTNPLLITLVAQFTAKATNSVKPIYFLWLIYCSINQLKSHMLFTCKKILFSNFRWKEIFASGNSGWGLTSAHSAPFYYAPEPCLFLLTKETQIVNAQTVMDVRIGMWLVRLSIHWHRVMPSQIVMEVSRNSRNICILSLKTKCFSAIHFFQTLIIIGFFID